MEIFNRKYALITGGASGIGLEFSKIFFPQYNLILVGRNQENLENAREDLLKMSGLPSESKIVLLTYDLSQISSAMEIFQKCKDLSLDVEVLINNAGSAVFGQHDSLDESKIVEMLNLNVMTPTLLCKYFGTEMKNKGVGYILNIASLAAYQPVPYISSYAASKSYILNFSEAIAKEYEDYGVVVTCLSPGHTDTNFFQNAGIGDHKHGFYSINTRISPKTVAKAGFDGLFSKRLSVIPGFKNNILANINRFATRKITAYISKYLTKGDLKKQAASK
jgi:short-subunit dehydrogenase